MAVFFGKTERESETKTVLINLIFIINLFINISWKKCLQN